MATANEVLIYMEILVAVTVLVSFICGVFSYVVIRPLNTSINQLSNAIQDIERLITAIDTREHEFDKRLVVVESDLAIINQRVEALVKYVHGIDTRHDGVLSSRVDFIDPIVDVSTKVSHLKK